MEPSEGKTPNMSRFENVSTKLRWRAELAKKAPDMAMDLSHHMDLEWFMEAFRKTRKGGAVGVDGETAQMYEENLEDNLQSLLDRAKSGSYRSPAIRRVHIPKDGKGNETRPIGITTFEDKVLQRAVVMALEPVYEQDFLDCSHGFRPGRSTHQALKVLREVLRAMGGGYIIDLDIRKFFGAPGQAWRFQWVKFPPRKGNEPPHRESSLGLMKVTTWVKRRQSDVQAVTQVKLLSLVISRTGGRQGRKPGRLQ